MEARVPGIAYTVETLQRLHRELSPEQCRLYLIIGADSLASLPKWKDYKRIPELADVIPVARPGVSDVSNDPELIAKLTTELGGDAVERILNNSVPYTGTPLSATEVRQQLKDGDRNVAIPSDVYRYSTARGLYI
jgi:nicotinate-nucleotide adenylyltransferase